MRNKKSRLYRRQSWSKSKWTVTIPELLIIIFQLQTLLIMDHLAHDLSLDKALFKPDKLLQYNSWIDSDPLQVQLYHVFRIKQGMMKKC
jgi:hypothetical protein